MTHEERQAFEEYVNLVEKCMNRNVDPCDNFVEYASGGYREEDFDSRKGEWPPSYCGCAYIVQSLLDNERISDPNFEKIRNFCRSKRTCLEGGLKEFFKSDLFNEFCGGVPAFNENWTAENFNWARAAGILSALQFNTIMFMNMKHLDNIKVIFMYALDFPEYIVDTMDEILETLELDDEKIADINNDLNVALENHPQDLGTNSFRRSGLELEDNFEIFDFRAFLETALCITINNNDIFHLGEGVMELLSFLNRLDRKVLANYLTVMATYQQFYQSNENLLDWELMKFFEPILISVGFAIHYNEEEDKKRRYVKEKFNQSFEEDKAEFPEDIQETEADVFGTNINQTLEYIEEHYSQSRIHLEYENLEISPTDFYQNLINLRNHGVPESVQTYCSIRGSEQEITTSILNLLEYVTAHWKKPIVFHMSGQEAANWRTIISLRIEATDDFYTKNNGENEKFIEILESQFRSYNNDLSFDFWPGLVISSIEAIKRTFRDYQTWMKENETVVRWQDEILSRINLDCHKLFFVAFVQHLTCCTASEKSTATLTLLNSEDFVRTFKCGLESPMNPRKFS